MDKATMPRARTKSNHEIPRRVRTVSRVKRGFRLSSLGFAISDTMMAKVEAPKIDRLRTKERNPSKDLMISRLLPSLGDFVSFTEEPVGTGEVIVASWLLEAIGKT